LSGRPPYDDRARYPLPVLLLLDLKMPRRSGFDVLQWLRNEAGMRRLPTVVFTSSSELSDVNRAFDLGANSYLVKPVNAAALSDVLRLVDRYWLVTNQRPEVAPPA
jgi:DNA-binding response OmpR family regulator